MKCRYAGAAALAAAIFAIDSFTMLSSAVAVLYVLVLILIGDTASERTIRATAAGCIALALFSFFYGHDDAVALDAVLRLVFSVAAVLATAFIVLKRLADQQTVASQAELLDVTSDAIFLTDVAGRVIYWNHGAEALYGWSFDEAYGQDPHALLATRSAPSRSAIRGALAREGSWEGEVTQTTRDGRTIHVFSRLRRRTEPGRYEGTTLETNTDITQRKAAIEALSQSEQRFRTIFETLAVAIWEHDLRPVKAELDALRAEGVEDLAQHLGQRPELLRRIRASVRITDVNSTGLRLMGVSSKEEFFTHLDGFLTDPDEDFIAFLLALDAGAPHFQSEAGIRTRQGELLRVLVAFNFPPPELLDRVQASVLNITERIRVQEALQRTRGQLDHALRAATIGEVSASIAHEINQPLAAISAHAAAAGRWMDRDPPNLAEVRASLDAAGAAAHHASQVVRRVRSFMTKVEPERTRLDVDALVEEAMRLVQGEIVSHGVALAPVLEADGVAVEGDRIMLQQVLINLITNAVQAMHATPAGERRIALRTWRAGGRVGIEVRDSGPGFGAEAAQKAFEPFFTTKAGGMGLGLAMCRTIVNAHDGEIRIDIPGDDAPGGRISITLPVAGRAAPGF
ncbi:PAS domain-containing sensor histidine kinase [Ancylobacter oerskovii]|uniref:histidine kinase n=1 Tax=Ancylobacter oerskovii TaxID=459519 RepID=A0ABW4YS92_9HYPH|nr:ATP-binding protein [Ancylobacter oerskovii]MBS7545317.1 PAS domain S-box protein [Ancylobacter oerskovii]